MRHFINYLGLAAVLGVLAFVLTPYAAYTHGWVGCMADLIWLSGALSLAVLVQRTRSAWATAMIAGVCTAPARLVAHHYRPADFLVCV